MCSKYKIVHLCKYEEGGHKKPKPSPEAPHTDAKVQDEIARMKMKISEIENAFCSPPQPAIQSPVGIHPDETIDFYNYSAVHFRESRVMNHGPFSWLTLVKKDKFGCTLWDKVVELKKQKKTDALEAFKRDPKGSKKSAEDEFRNTLLENEGIVDLAPYKEGELKKNGSKETLPLGLSINKGDSEAHTVDQIRKILPTKRVLWILIDRFFSHVYPFMPYVDQLPFITECERLIGPRSYENVVVKNLTIEKRLDFAHMCLLLLVARFGCLSLEKDAEECLKLGIEAVTVAQLCLNQFRLLRKCTLVIFQCALYMRLYHKHAPEDGDGGDGGDSQIFTGMLIQMATSIGLNRDPAHFAVFFQDSKVPHLWCKIWSCLLTFNTFQGCILGNPQTIMREFYDTPLPKIEPHHLEMERNVILEIQQQRLLEEKIDKVTKLALNLKECPRIAEIVSLVDELNFHISRNYGSLYTILQSRCISDSESVRKVKKLVQYLETRQFIHSIYHHLFLHYEERQNTETAYFFLEKILTCIIEVVANFINLCKNSTTFFGPGFDYMVIPSVELAMHKTVQIQIAIVLRCFTCGPQRHMAQEICKQAIANIELYLDGLNQLSGRYYYAWRMSKAQKFLLGLIKQQFETVFESGKGALPFSISNPGFNVLNQLSNLQMERISRILIPQNENISNSDMSPNGSVSATDADSFWMNMITEGQLNPHRYNFSTSEGFGGPGKANMDIDIDQMLGDDFFADFSLPAFH